MGPSPSPYGFLTIFCSYFSRILVSVSLYKLCDVCLNIFCQFMVKSNSKCTVNMELQDACFTVLNLRNLDYIQNRQNLISALYSKKCELPLHTHYYRWSTACSKIHLFSTISIYVKGLQLIFCHYTAVIFINTSQIDQKMAGIHGRVMFQSVLQCTQQNNVTSMYQHHLLCQPVSPEVMKFRSYIFQRHV